MWERKLGARCRSRPKKMQIIGLMQLQFHIFTTIRIGTPTCPSSCEEITLTIVSPGSSRRWAVRAAGCPSCTAPPTRPGTWSHRWSHCERRTRPSPSRTSPAWWSDCRGWRGPGPQRGAAWAATRGKTAHSSCRTNKSRTHQNNSFRIQKEHFAYSDPDPTWTFCSQTLIGIPVHL